ncbi:hypothetical protein, variant [Aphanomyces astaci]|uniref:Intimal thickness related receptor IRP domain-containing protein n=1 Tax=Aphanomyces astaci TaxID=112090 RepID=W4FNM0_APHAT|nr:hypothetical protein, variant [Aphanomyces astaci]ETV69062.1 hypothetical protein, variant [Aphanomyces astaci]|eukprot:XP_009841521.1 hypothetical protein, variant [Aphanomyces astaci]
MTHRSMVHQALAAMLVLVCCMTLPVVDGLKQKWSFTEETRRQFLIERFGFDVGGHMDVQVEIPHLSQAPRSSLLFVHEDELVEDAAAYFTQPYNEDLCLLDNQTATDRMDFADNTTWHLSHTVATPGFYYLLFAHCGDTDTSLTFSMDASFLNPNANYLSSGDALVPLIYLLTSVIFGTGVVLWARTLHRNALHIHHIHHMMTGLLLLKVVSTFCESMRFFYMKSHGDTLTSWNVVFYIFMFLKGMAMFVVILLIGTGWSILKQHLNRTEKRIVFVVLLLQVANNVAVVVLQESSVGTQAWVRWRDAMHLLDILCCCAILFPIVWSIRQLRETAQVDGKAQINLRKLTQFRGFYVAVVTYVYFTRIALYLLAASLPYTMTWVTVAVAEVAALAFYAYTGYVLTFITFCRNELCI